MDEEEEDEEVVVLHPPRVKLIKSPAPRGRAVLIHVLMFIDMQASVRVAFISLTKNKKRCLFVWWEIGPIAVFIKMRNFVHGYWY